MSHLKSGLWCDLCKKPILDGEYWHIKVQNKDGHSCEKCKLKYELDKTKDK